MNCTRVQLSNCVSVCRVLTLGKFPAKFIQISLTISVKFLLKISYQYTQTCQVSHILHLTQLRGCLYVAMKAATNGDICLNTHPPIGDWPLEGERKKGRGIEGINLPCGRPKTLAALYTPSKELCTCLHYSLSIGFHSTCSLYQCIFNNLTYSVTLCVHFMLLRKQLLVVFCCFLLFLWAVQNIRLLSV